MSKLSISLHIKVEFELNIYTLDPAIWLLSLYIFVDKCLQEGERMWHLVEPSQHTFDSLWRVNWIHFLGNIVRTNAIRFLMFATIIICAHYIFYVRYFLQASFIRFGWFFIRIFFPRLQDKLTNECKPNWRRKNCKNG